MSENPIEAAIRDVQAALGTPPDQPPPEVFRQTTDNWPLWSGEGASTPEEVLPVHPPAGEIDTEPQSEVLTGDPIWDALHSLKALCDLLPPTPGSESRLCQCVMRMRDTASKELFAGVDPDPLADDSLSPISYPRLEVNKAVRSARHLLLELLPRVEFERRLRELLDRELQKSDPFLEDDDRGTIQGMIEPSGPSHQKMRNDSKLHALGVFLDALRRQPFAAVRCAVRLLSNVTIPSSLLSVDVIKCEVTFRSTAYSVSDHTAHFIRLLIAAQGGIVSSGDLKKALKVSTQIRTDRLKEGLPKPLGAAIVTDKRGSRLDVDLLMSYA